MSYIVHAFKLEESFDAGNMRQSGVDVVIVDIRFTRTASSEVTAFSKREQPFKLHGRENRWVSKREPGHARIWSFRVLTLHIQLDG